MNDENDLCCICLEKFDKQNKLPKKTNCCRNIICLQCLKDIYIKKQLSLCPICRFDQKVQPDQLANDLSVFEAYVSCPNCQQNAIKSELFFSFTTNTIKCLKCQSEDMLLYDYTQMMMSDLVDFLEVYPSINENVLIDLLNLRLSLQIDALFNRIKEKMMIVIKDRLFVEMKSKFNYDIIKNPSLLKNDINTLNTHLSNMKSFLNDNQIKQVSLNNLMQTFNKYLKEKEAITQQSSAYQHANKILKESNMFNLKENIQITELQEFFANIIETCLSDHEKMSYMTGIKFFDNYYNELLNKNKDLSKNINENEIFRSKTNFSLFSENRNSFILEPNTFIHQTPGETKSQPDNDEKQNNKEISIKNNNTSEKKEECLSIWDMMDTIKID